MKGEVCITVSEPSPDKPTEQDFMEYKKNTSPPQFLIPQPLSRRRSFSILSRRESAKEKRSITPSPELLRRQSAKEKSLRKTESPPLKKKLMTHSSKWLNETGLLKKSTSATGSILSEQTAPAKINILLSKTTVQSPLNKKSSLDSWTPGKAEPSPPPLPSPLTYPTISTPSSTEAPDYRRASYIQGSDSTVVHVIVHRESEDCSFEQQGS